MIDLKHPKARKSSGGICIFVRSNLRDGIKYLDTNSSELMWVKISKRNNKH